MSKMHCMFKLFEKFKVFKIYDVFDAQNFYVSLFSIPFLTVKYCA